MSSDESVVVVATFVAAEGNEGKVEQALRNAVPPVHGEPGCVRYALHRDLRDPATFVMIEKWASAEALRTHSKAPALATLVAALDGLLARQFTVQTLSGIPAGDSARGNI